MSTWQEKAREKAEWAIHGYWCQESNCDVALTEDFEGSAERALASATVTALAPVVEAEVRRGQAEALREFGPWVQQEHACDPEEECPEGTCRLCDLLFAVYSDANDRADAIEAGDPR